VNVSMSGFSKLLNWLHVNKGRHTINDPVGGEATILLPITLMNQTLSFFDLMKST
jgi:hypothetical protein